jgi:hypothetical protein
VTPTRTVTVQVVTAGFQVYSHCPVTVTVSDSDRAFVRRAATPGCPVARVGRPSGWTRTLDGRPGQPRAAGHGPAGARSPWAASARCQSRWPRVMSHWHGHRDCQWLTRKLPESRELAINGAGSPITPGPGSGRGEAQARGRRERSLAGWRRAAGCGRPARRRRLVPGRASIRVTVTDAGGRRAPGRGDRPGGGPQSDSVGCRRGRLRLPARAQ